MKKITQFGPRSNYSIFCLYRHKYTLIRRNPHTHDISSLLLKREWEWKQKLHLFHLWKSLPPTKLHSRFPLLSLYITACLEQPSSYVQTPLYSFSHLVPKNHTTQQTILFNRKERKMSPTWVFVLGIIAAMLVVVNGQSSVKPLVKTVKGKKVCDKGWECKGWSAYCCNETISDYFQTYQFENLFAKRNSPVAHAVGFWDYRSFITAAALYQPHGFGTTGGKTSGQKELAAFFGHVGSKTSCKYI